MNQWISVNDWLPGRDEGWCLVARQTIGGVRVCSAIYEDFHPGGVRLFLRFRCAEPGQPWELVPCNAIAWMPLPEPPNE